MLTSVHHFSTFLPNLFVKGKFYRMFKTDLLGGGGMRVIHCVPSPGH